MALTIEIDPQEVFKVTLRSGQVLLFETAVSMLPLIQRELGRMMAETKSLNREKRR